jgi:hypothetical protein
VLLLLLVLRQRGGVLRLQLRRRLLLLRSHVRQLREAGRALALLLLLQEVQAVRAEPLIAAAVGAALAAQPGREGGSVAAKTAIKGLPRRRLLLRLQAWEWLLLLRRGHAPVVRLRLLRRLRRRLLEVLLLGHGRVHQLAPPLQGMQELWVLKAICTWPLLSKGY